MQPYKCQFAYLVCDGIISACQTAEFSCLTVLDTKFQCQCRCMWVECHGWIPTGFQYNKTFIWYLYTNVGDVVACLFFVVDDVVCWMGCHVPVSLQHELLGALIFLFVSALSNTKKLVAGDRSRSANQQSYQRTEAPFSLSTYANLEVIISLLVIPGSV